MQFRPAREAKGWSQEHLAAASGVSLRTVQRAEAGARISSENTLALCATLEIQLEATPTPPSVPATGPAALPHLHVMRRELDKALAEYGERPLWRKADATPVLFEALRRKGFPGETVGFLYASNRLRRRYKRMSMACEIFEPLQFVWVLSLVAMPMCLMGLTADYPAKLATIGLLVAAWILLTISLAVFMHMRDRANRQMYPTSLPDIRAAGIVMADISPLEAALTREFLWMAEMTDSDIRVWQSALPPIRGWSNLHGADLRNRRDSPPARYAWQTRDARPRRFSAGRRRRDQRRVPPGRKVALDHL